MLSSYKKMDYYIAISPDLRIDSVEFVKSWNDSSECRSLSKADIVSAGKKKYDIGLLSDALVVLGSISVSIAASAIFELIKTTLAKKAQEKETEFILLDNPDGSRMIVVKVKEKNQT